MTTPEYKPTKIELKFKKYYDKLIWETINARAHLKLWERLEKYKSSHLHELNQAPHFFNFTIKAHLDDALLTLSRILDKHGKALSIWKLLNFAEQNIEIFSTEVFRQRMIQKPKFWTESHRPTTLKEIEQHRQKLRSLESALGNLKEWRKKVLAHTDHEFLLKGKIISKEYPLQRQQLQEVIESLVEILNRCSLAYDSSTFLEKFIGEDDVQRVMDAIRSDIEDRKKQLAALRKQALDKR